jgi:hypothetical protein
VTASNNPCEIGSPAPKTSAIDWVSSREASSSACKGPRTIRARRSNSAIVRARDQAVIALYARTIAIAPSPRVVARATRLIVPSTGDPSY